MSENMKVTVINSSPNMNKGNTALILNPFVEGMEEKGAEVGIFYTNDLKINPCRGDMVCLKSTGECFQEDDMEWLLPEVSKSDIIVFASPLYCDGVTGPMKMFMDRLVPMGHLTMEIRENRVRHPLREGWKVKKAVLVSNCGFWEIDSFEPIIAHIKAFCNNINAEYAGELLRPHGPFLNGMLKMGMPVNDIIESAKKAGNEVIDDGKVSDETSDKISRPLITRDEFVQMCNTILQDDR